MLEGSAKWRKRGSHQGKEGGHPRWLFEKAPAIPKWGKRLAHDSPTTEGKGKKEGEIVAHHKEVGGN